MFQNLEVFRMSSAMAVHAGRRQAVVAQNVANADTPGYVAHDLPSFAKTVQRDGAGYQLATRARHLHGDHTGPTVPPRPVRSEASPNGNNVSIERQMVQASVAKREHDRALAIYKSALTMLRTSLGR